MAIARTVDRRLFFVLDRAFLKLAQAADRTLSDGSGIGRSQAAVLVYLGYHDGCSLSELAEGTGRKNAAISGLVDRMEAVDLILRKRSHGDRRQCHVFLSDKGVDGPRSRHERFSRFQCQAAARPVGRGNRGRDEISEPLCAERVVLTATGPAFARSLASGLHNRTGPHSWGSTQA